MPSCCRRRDFCERAAYPPPATRHPPVGRAAVIVIKFGGWSVGDADRVADAIDIVAERRDRDPIVVVSALAGVTNDLVAASEAACAQEPRQVATIIKSIRERHEDVAMRLVQQKSD